MNDSPLTNVERPDQVAELAEVLESAPWHALDTESNSGFAYRERLSLLQLNVGGRLWLVDLVTLADSEELGKLWAPLASAEHTTYLHGGEFDVGCFKRDYDVELRAVWDSQQAASFLGWEKTGYGAVVEAVCGVALDKAYTQYDWARRPLAQEVLQYAIDDVRYLPEVCRELEARIAEADLVEELAIANRAVEEATWDGAFRPEGFWKVRGVGNLPAACLPTMVALWHWRDEVARAENRAPGRTLNNRMMLALAKRPPRTVKALKKSGIRGRLLERGPELLERIEAARTSPPVVPPRPRLRESSSAEMGRRIRRREEKLKAWRTNEAARRGVPLQVVLPSRALAHLKHHGAESFEEVPQFGEKRARLYGDELKQLVE